MFAAATQPTYAPKVFASDKGCGFSKADLKDAMDRLLENKENQGGNVRPAIKA